MKRGGWVVILLIGVIIGYVAGVNLPDSFSKLMGKDGTNQPVMEVDSSSSQTVSEEPDAKPKLEPKALANGDWLLCEFLPASSVACATVDLEAVYRDHGANAPGIAALFDREPLLSMWQNAAMDALGPCAEELIPMIPEWTSLEIFALPPSREGLMADLVVHADWPQPDFEGFSERVLGRIAADIPNAATAREELEGYPLHCVRGEGAELVALAETGGIWVANHRAVLQNLIAARPGEVTPVSPVPSEPLSTQAGTWLTLMVARPPGEVPPGAPLGWLWNAPWCATSFRLEASDLPGASILTAALDLDEDALPEEVWPAAFTGLPSRPAASLGRIALSMPKPQPQTGPDESAERQDRRERKQKSKAQSGREKRAVRNRDGASKSAFGKRGLRGGLLPPMDSVVIDLVDTGAADPPWLARIPDPDGEIENWLIRIVDGGSPLSKTVDAQPVGNGEVTAFEFLEDGPYARWFGTTRVFAAAAPGEVLFFVDEAVMEQLEALSVPALDYPPPPPLGAKTPPKQVDGEGETADANYLAYADLTPELILALMAFEAGGGDQAAEVVKTFKSLVGPVTVSAERQERRVLLTSEAPTGPANFIGLATLFTAIRMLLAN